MHAVSKRSIRLAVVLAVLAGCSALYLPSLAQKGPFQHSTKKHQSTSCSTCHTMPTANWPAARGFPDVAQFPSHKACFTCHSTAAVFSGGKPAFCLGCHTDVGPGRGPLYKFPVATRKVQFETKFPHDVHQDIFAGLLKNEVATGHFVNASWSSSAAQGRAAINTCAICHVQSKAAQVTVTVPPIDEGLRNGEKQPAATEESKKAAFFKTMPEGHQTCFACHYSGINPASTDCAGCHKPADKPYVPSDALPRYSIKFDHTNEKHNRDCMACHIRIAQSSDSRQMKGPDVPVSTCSSTSCHGNVPVKKEQINLQVGQPGFSEFAISNEKRARDKTPAYQCSYCHSSDVGRFKVPQSHLVVAK